METLRQDLRFGLRLLARSPGFSTVAILTLGVGIAATTATFSVTNAFLWRSLPFDRPERLVHVWQTDRAHGASELRVSVPNFLDWREQASVFDDLGGYFYGDFNLSGRDGVDPPIRIMVGRLTPNLLDLLGVRPALGRGFLPDEDQAGKDRVVVASDGFWRRHFAADPRALGESIPLDGVSYTLVGVMPPEFVFPLKATQLWTPLSLERWKSQRETDGPLLVVGRLRPEINLDEARADLSTLMKRLEQEHPVANRGKGANLVPLRKALLFFHDTLQATFAVVFVAAGLILLMVCANVGNLLLARATGRSREMAVRSALGGSRARLVRQLLTESTLLALGGSGVGVLLAYGAAAAAGPLLPEDLYRVGDITVDGLALGFALGVAFLAALVFGLAPAVETTRLNLSQNLKEGDGSGSAGLRSRRLRSVLVVAQVALAAVLLVGSGLMIRSLLRLTQVAPGFNPDQVLTAELILPSSRYGTEREQNLFYEQALERLRALPGVESAAAVYPLPLNFESLSQAFAVEGRPPAQSGEKLQAGCFWVTADYFRTLQIPLERGRVFTNQDNDQSGPVVLINQTLAERFWPGVDPVGRQVRLDPGTPAEKLAVIVGVVGDSKQFLMNEEPSPLIYLPQLQDSTRRRFLILRASGDPLALVPALRQEIGALDPTQPLTALRSMNQVVEESLGPWAGGTLVIGVLGSGALVLAALGIYGLMSYWVGQRRHELGIRKALGAGASDIKRLVLRQGVVLAATGAVIGLAAAAAFTRLMQALLYGVSVLDPLTFLATPLLLGGVAFLAAFLPARRATRVDPMLALRCE
jgi:putative ABC transport system permease protein